VPARLLACWLRGEYELIVSPLLLEEVGRVLAYPKIRARIPADDAAELLDLLRRSARLVPDPPQPPRRSADPADDYLLALAEAAQAVVVSGDAHLLDLSDRLPIRTARAFLASLEGRG